MSEASWEVANLTKSKYPHTLVYGVKEGRGENGCIIDVDGRRWASKEQDGQRRPEKSAVEKELQWA